MHRATFLDAAMQLEADPAFQRAEAMAQALRRTAGSTALKQTSRRKHRQRRSNETLTATQLETVTAFADCESNYAATARRLGKALATVRESIAAAYRKLGQQVPKSPAKSGTRRLPTDARGNATITTDARKK